MTGGAFGDNDDKGGDFSQIPLHTSGIKHWLQSLKCPLPEVKLKPLLSHQNCTFFGSKPELAHLTILTQPPFRKYEVVPPDLIPRT